MKYIGKVLVLGLLLVPNAALAGNVLTVTLKSTEVGEPVALGILEVPEVGTVRLSAKRNGNQVSVQALGPDGAVAGEAETVIGVGETPLYLKSASGFQLLTVRWGGAGKP
jgi:hypothetical protein